MAGVESRAGNQESLFQNPPRQGTCQQQSAAGGDQQARSARDFSLQALPGNALSWRLCLLFASWQDAWQSPPGPWEGARQSLGTRRVRPLRAAGRNSPCRWGERLGAVESLIE